MKGGEKMLINEWWTALNHGKLRKDYDGNYGVQCVDVANSYAEHVLGFGKGVFYGVRYAKEIFNHHNTRLFEAEKNGRSNYPAKGSLVIWNRGTAGHIAIVIKATEHTIAVCEGNYDGKGSLRTHTYTNYNNVVGWLKPYAVVNTSRGVAACSFLHRVQDRNRLDSSENIKAFLCSGEKVYLSGSDSDFYQVRQKSNKKVDNYIFKKYLKI